MIDHHQFIHVGDIAGFPRRELDLLQHGLAERAAAQDIHRGPAGHHGGFEQAVAGEPVGAVQAGAAHLPHGIQATQTGGAIHIGADAAALIVGGGHHRDAVLRHIDPGIQQGLVDVGESLAEELPRLAGDVQIDAGVAGLLDLAVDRPGHDIARGEGFPDIILLHEFLAIGADEHAPLTADGFRDEEALDGGMIEAGGVELDELHVRKGGPGPPGHGHAIAGRDFGIGGIKIDAPAPASGQHHAVAAEGGHFRGGLIQHIKP